MTNLNLSPELGAPEMAAGWPDGNTASDVCRTRLHCLSPADWMLLRKFAAFRLARVGLSPEGDEDMVQDALLAVLLGLKGAARGRHPRAGDLASHSHFMEYLRGVIASRVEAERRQLRHQIANEALTEAEAVDRRLVHTPNNAIESWDFARHFFVRVIERAPDRLRPVVREWAAQWEHYDRIPLHGSHRRCRTVIRRVATEVWKQIVHPVPTENRRNTR